MDTDYLIVGKIGSTYGIKGWVKIISYTELATNLLTYNPWYIEKNGQWDRIDVEEGREYGPGIIVKLAGFNTPEKARLIAGKNIAIQKSQLPALQNNEYYWNDLKGLTVFDQEGKNLGIVIYLIATGSHDVLVVKGEKEHAIPYQLGSVIKNVDLEKKLIVVDWEVI